MEVNDETLNVSWVFTKTSLPKYIHIQFKLFYLFSVSFSLLSSRPVLYLPCSDKPSVMVKFCPVLFELREQWQATTSLIE